MIATQDLLAALIGAGSVSGLGGVILLLRRRWSRDNLEIAKDRVELDLFTAVLRERDYLREEVRKLNESYTQCLRSAERLVANAEGDQETIQRLERDASRLLNFAPDSVKKLLETNFGELGERRV